MVEPEIGHEFRRWPEINSILNSFNRPSPEEDNMNNRRYVRRSVTLLKCSTLKELNVIVTDALPDYYTLWVLRSSKS